MLVRNVQIYSTNLKVAQSKNNINNSDAFVSKNEKRNTFLKSFLPFERGFFFFEVVTSDIKASLFYIFYIPKRNSALKKPLKIDGLLLDIILCMLLVSKQ